MIGERVSLDRLLEGCQIIGPDYRYVYLNEVAARHARVDVAALIGRTMMEVYPGIESTPMFGALRACMERRAPQALENQFTYPDGHRAWFDLRFEPVPEGVAVLSMDATPRRAAARALRRAQRALGVASACRRAIAGARAEAQLFADVCDIVVRTGGYGAAWVGLKDDGPGHAVRPVAAAGIEDAEQTHDITWDDAPQGRGPTGRAVRGGEAVVARALDDEGDAPRWLMRAGARGLGASLSVPLRVDGVVVGALDISAEVDAFDEAEQALLEDLAADVGFGLAGLRARARLAESEARYQLLLEHAPVGVAVHVEGRLEFVNPAGARLLGADRPEALVGRALGEIIHPDGLERSNARGARMLAGEAGLYPAPDRYVRLDGSVVDVEVTAVPLTYQGRPAVQAIVVDVSRRLAAERARLESEARFRHVFEAANVGKSITQPTGEMSVNRAYAEQLGYTPEELKGKTWRDLVAPQDLPIAEALVAGLLKPDGPSAARRELRYLHKGGSIVWADLNTAVWRDDEGRRVGFITTVVDITERKKAEEALSANEAFIRTVMDNLPVGVAVHSVLPELRFSYINDMYLQLYRTTREALARPEGFWEAVYLDPDLRARAAQSAFELYRRDELHTIRWEDVPIRRPGEPTTYVSATATKVPGTELVVSIVWDETARHQAEAERTHLEQQLLQGQRMEAVGRLAGGVAHDFNNLLSVIISYAGFIAESLSTSDPSYADVCEIQKAGERAAALTRQLLAFSRRQILQPEVLNLNHVVISVVDMLRRLLGEDITVETFLAEGLHNVLADPGQLDQVIMNLAVNGRDAMPDGGTLSIETANVSVVAGAPDQPFGLRPGRYVLLSVTDNGTGMDAVTQEHIFEPFFTTKDKGRGTGLGLSTVYGIVKQSGGAIGVHSAPGAGTTFLVYLPRVDTALTPRRTPPPVVVSGRETVLIVEDEDAVRRSAERILRAAGYKVYTADSGGNALVLCERHGDAIDLLLADVVMPQMSGPELAARLTRQWPRIKVLYMSGYTDDALGQRGVLGRDIAFIGKPFVAAALTGKVRQVLDGL